MKRVYILCLALIGCCAVTAYVAYTLGYRKSFDLSETIRYGDVIVSHDALVDLRSGRIDDGTRKVEAMYFKNAAILYGDSRFQKRFLGITNAAFTGDIRQYLASYHTNHSDWTRMTVQLQKNLKDWR